MDIFWKWSPFKKTSVFKKHMFLMIFRWGNTFFQKTTLKKKKKLFFQDVLEKKTCFQNTVF